MQPHAIISFTAHLTGTSEEVKGSFNLPINRNKTHARCEPTDHYYPLTSV